MLNGSINALYSLVSNSAHGLYYYSVTSPHTQKLINAIRQKDIQTLRTELKNGADFQAVGFERSLLHEAIQCQNLDAVTELVSHYFIDTNEICEDLTPLGRAIKLGNQPIAEILIQHRASVSAARLQTMPSALQVAVKNKQLAARDAEALINRMQNGNISYDAIATYLEPISKQLTFERNIIEGYNQHFQQAKAAMAYLERHQPYSYNSTIRFETGAVNVRCPQLIIRYASKFNIPKLKQDLARAELNSPEWHQLRSMLMQQQALAKEYEELPIEDYAKRCKEVFSEKKVNVEIKIEPQYDNFNGTQVQLLYPEFEIAQADKLKQLQAGLAPFMAQGAPLVEVLRNNQPQQAIACLHKELTEQTEPALHMACRLKSHNMVKMLLQAKANVNQLHKGFSALQIALTQDDEELAILLLENGANPDVSIEGNTALHIAAIRNQPRLAQALILKHANPSVECEGETAFDLAARLQNVDVLRVFHCMESMLASRRFGGYSKRGGLYYSNTSAFSWNRAIAQHDESLMYALEQLQIDCNDIDHSLGTPLHHAIKLGDERLINRLLSIGANPAMKFQGKNAIEYAVYLASLATTRPNRYSKIVELLILHDLPTKLRLSSLKLLNYCIEQQLWHGVRHLTNSGMPSSREWCTLSNYTQPPLLNVINHQATPVIYSVLTADEQRKAAAWCIQNKKAPPLNLAVQKNDMNLIQILMQNAGADLASVIDNPLLHDAILRNGYRRPNSQVIRYLVENGCDINAIHQDLSVLQAAVLFCEDDITKELLTYPNIEMNRQNAQGDTALHLALRNPYVVNHVDLVRDLIADGADLFLQNQRGECPFDMIMINAELRKKMMEIYGDAFINDNIVKRNCLAVFLSHPDIHTRLINDTNIGEGGYTWLREQSVKGTKEAEACLAQLMAHDSFYSDFIKERFEDPYHQYLLDNQTALIAYCNVLCTPEPKPVVNHYKNSWRYQMLQEAMKERREANRYKPY